MSSQINLKEWDFEINEYGIKEKVELPHTWNVSDVTAKYRGKAVYTTQVQLTGCGDIDRVVLYFGAVYNSADIYVNGVYVNTFRNSYAPFELDITDYIKDGNNLIMVEADNSPREDLLPHMLDFDWADDGGLIRNAVLSLYGKNDIQSMKVMCYVVPEEDGTCRGDIEVSFAGAADRDAVISISEADSRKTVLEQSVKAGCSQVRLAFEGLKLWSTESPFLYNVTVRNDVDEKCVRTGLRTIEVQGNKVLLNGKEIFLKGCEWMPGSHPDYGMAEPAEHIYFRLSQLKDSGCNFTRFHWQQDTSLFDWCDENGLLVQEEIPYWGHPKKAGKLQLEIAMAQAAAMVEFHGHHPSIICWGAGNELGGNEPETLDYTDKIYQYFKKLDSYRLVNYVSNTFVRDDVIDLEDAAVHGDIVMWNDYLGLWQPCEDIEGYIRRAVKKCGNKPLVVSEFGLCEPAFSGGDERRGEILESRVEIYRRFEEIAGYVWFSLNDYRTQMGEEGEGRYRQRVHGSTDLYGNRKPSYDILCRL